MEIDRELGNVIIKDNEGTESHIIPPEFGDFDGDREIQKHIISLVTTELGNFEDIEEFNLKEERSVGEYTVDGKSYKSQNYRLDVVEDELYFGASGGTEQIILAILSGAVGGMVGAITTRIFDLVANKIKGEYSSGIEDKSFDEKQLIIERILTKRFRAARPITYLQVTNRKNLIECEIEDSEEQRFLVKMESKNGVLHVNFKKDA